MISRLDINGSTFSFIWLKIIISKTLSNGSVFLNKGITSANLSSSENMPFLGDWSIISVRNGR